MSHKDQPSPTSMRERLLTVTSSEATGTLTDLNGNSQNTVVLDVAGYDLLVSAGSPVPLASRTEVSLVTNYSPAPCQLSGIVHWRQERGDSWEIGIALPEPAPENLLFVAGGSSREAIRFRSSIQGELWETQTGLASRAIVLNYSRDGFCLSCNQRVEAGKTVIFHWEEHGNNSMPLRRSVSAHVRWSSDVVGSFLIGCDLISGTRYALSGIDVDEHIRRLQTRSQNWSRLFTDAIAPV
jgi:hypothetical protein